MHVNALYFQLSSLPNYLIPSSSSFFHLLYNPPCHRSLPTAPDPALKRLVHRNNSSYVLNFFRNSPKVLGVHVNRCPVIYIKCNAITQRRTTVLSTKILYAAGSTDALCLVESRVYVSKCNSVVIKYAFIGITKTRNHT